MLQTYFFSVPEGVIAVLGEKTFFDPIANDSGQKSTVEKLQGIFEGILLDKQAVQGTFIGPRSNVVSPWSSNASSILSAAGLNGCQRCELFLETNSESLDPMLEQRYTVLDQKTLMVTGEKEALRHVEDIRQYNTEFGLALSEEEIDFLENASQHLGRKLTDTEVYGFGQINSEHCRHKIFNADFIIDGKQKEKTLFGLIKDTTKAAGSHVVSAYKDNVAFINGFTTNEFAPKSDHFYGTSQRECVISLKAETHNFPTTVEPFYGASTGSGGEIRDRMAGGLGGQVHSGLAVYMTADPRLGSGLDEQREIPERQWAYQTPQQILTKASNGASDFGNKFGQPLLGGSLLTAEVQTDAGLYAYDRCIMLAGGVGTTPSDQAQKNDAKVGDLVVVLGGENFRIGMAGGSVSSVNSGQMSVAIELSAVQRANPEMQKRVYNVIRTLVEMAANPIKLIHDHGAGGHINCLSELIEATGGCIDIDALPVGDTTLSLREILCNESQERIGLVISPEDRDLLQSLCDRERAPMYIVGKITGDNIICYKTAKETAFELPVATLFGATPKLTMTGAAKKLSGKSVHFKNVTENEFEKLLGNVLSLEGVGSKDWLTNKVDRCVSGRVARQQCVGKHQLPLANCSITAADYTSNIGIATALGSAPLVGLVNSAAGARIAVAEALLNLGFTPLEHKQNALERVALSANWMWPAKSPEENARLYEAVAALSEFCIALKIPVPTGKDSLSMTMQYAGGEAVRAPGTVIVTAVAPTKDFRKTILPVLEHVLDSQLIVIDFTNDTTYPLGGSALLQVLNAIGETAPDIADARAFQKGFEALQALIGDGKILAGHDVSYGGLITTALEMSFASDVGIDITCDAWQELFCEKPAVVLQVKNSAASEIISRFTACGLTAKQIAMVSGSETIKIKTKEFVFEKPLAELRKVWFSPSAQLEVFQTHLAAERTASFAQHPLKYIFPKNFSGIAEQHAVHFPGIPTTSKKSLTNTKKVIAAVVREQGTNGERELAFALTSAGFEVKDVTMTDLISGREDLSDASFLAFPGGFSFSDCLGAGKGWAASFLYNSKAKTALENFYARKNTLSIGICNGCQVMAALELLYPEAPFKMLHNKSKKLESNFLAVNVVDTKSIMLKPLIGSKLGIWIAHGEGQFNFPEAASYYDIPVRYVDCCYPVNPNGSPLNAAAVCSKDGRHLAIMPHLERSSLPWNWGYYPKEDLLKHEISPWMLAFVAAKNWIVEQNPS